MASRILGQPSEIGKRWPHRALNFLSTPQKWKYLAWKASNSLPKIEPSLSFGQILDNSPRILILLPEDFSEILLTIPVLQSLLRVHPGIELLLLSSNRAKPFLSILFGPSQVVDILPEEFFWGEHYFKEIIKAVQDFKPIISVNFRGETPPLFAYLLLSGRAQMRIFINDFGVKAEEIVAAQKPFSTIVLNPKLLFDPESKSDSESAPKSNPLADKNYLRRYALLLSLWNFSKTPVNCTWSRLKPSADQLKMAHEKIASKGLDPSRTRIFLWQNENLELQRKLLSRALSERQGSGESLSLLVLTATVGPFSYSPPLPEEVIGLPNLEVGQLGLLLAYFDSVPHCLGLNGPLLHFASLTETTVSAFYEKKDAPWDVSWLNPKFKILPL